MDDLSNEELEQLLGVFREQALTVLEDMSQDILSLEHNNADAEAMARLRRSAHTIKGDSACIGLDGITEVSHRMEDLIEGVRGNRLSIDASLVNVLLQALDEMRLAIGADAVRDVSPDALQRVLDAMAQIEEGQDAPSGDVPAPGSHKQGRDDSAEQSAAGSQLSPERRTAPTGTRGAGRTLQDQQAQPEQNRVVLPDGLVEIIKGCIDDGRQVYLHNSSKSWLGLINTALGEEGCPVSLLFE